MMLVGVVVVAKIQYELFLLFSLTFTKYSYLKFKRSEAHLLTTQKIAVENVEWKLKSVFFGFSLHICDCLGG